MATALQKAHAGAARVSVTASDNSSLIAHRSALHVFERAEIAAQFIRSRDAREIEVACVLGSGLGAFAGQLEDRTVIPYSEIPHFARPTVEGHSGQLVIGGSGGKTVAVMSGRFHYYEGHPLDDVTFPVRVFGRLEIPTLILTNAAGAINTHFAPGTLMLITDHINLMGANPLRGANDERFGPRFPDLSAAYSPALRDLALRAAEENGIRLEQGVYVAVSGPSYETPAEIRMLRALGADAVGMSTVPEAIVARHQGMQVAAISCLTNMAAGILDQPLSHEEVVETGNRVREQFASLLASFIAKI